MGTLDDLFDPQTYAPKGGIPDAWQKLPEDAGFDGVDYSGDVPVMRKKIARDLFDEGKKKLDEAHPYVPASGPFPAVAPPQAAPGMPSPGLGMLGPEMGGPFGAIKDMPPGTNVVNAGGMPASASAPLPSSDIKPAPEPKTDAPPAPAMNAMAADTPKADPDTGAIDMTRAPVGMLSKVWDGIKANSGLLMGMGAGMTGAPSWAQGFGRGFAGAAAGANQDYKQSLQTSGQQSLYQSLRNAMIKNGVNPQTASLQAISATTNPKMAEALIAQYITGEKGELKNIFVNGVQTSVLHHPHEEASKAITDLQGNPLPTGGATGDIDPSLTGPEAAQALQQANPDRYRRAMALVAGQEDWPNARSMDKGDNRIVTQLARQIDPDLSEANAQARKVWTKSLADTKSGVGLQSKGFQQGLEHFVKLSDNLVKMNLSNGLGSEDLAKGVNWMKSRSTEQQQLIHKSDVIGQALSREMGNLFSKNGGGVHEAAETKKALSNAFMSSKSAAGSLEAVDELMHGGLTTLEQRRNDLFPNGNAPKGSQFLGPAQEEALAHIRRNIAILKGEEAAAPAAAATTAPAPGKYVWDGHKMVRQ